jgi:hypothetical protein
MIIRTISFAVVLGLTISVCSDKASIISDRKQLAGSAATTTPGRRPLSEIDLSQIDHVAPKGRVQDKDYNNLVIIDGLLTNGNDAIPFLISKLEDETEIDHHVFDYWPGPVRVGDVAFVILMDFTTDSSWMRSTIPGADRDSILGKYDPNLPGVERLTRAVEKHGRKPIRKKWEKIWAEHKEQIIWDERERCFTMRDQFSSPYTIYDSQ